MFFSVPSRDQQPLWDTPPPQATVSCFQGAGLPSRTCGPGLQQTRLSGRVRPQQHRISFWFNFHALPAADPALASPLEAACADAEPGTGRRDMGLRPQPP